LIVAHRKIADKQSSQDSAKDAGLGDRVRAWMEELSHVLKAFLYRNGPV
jgi:hypothetical protein